jgi:uncharacterized damage-inducible protein DinB
MSNPYAQENTAARERLIALVNRLTDEELSRPVEAGWTVAGFLAHMAFWDRRALILLRKWKQEGIGPSPIDTDVVNEAMREHCTAIPPRAAAQMAVACAAAIDQEIEQLDAQMLAAVEADGGTVHLNRATHRKLHLEQIERALKIQRGG